MRIITDITISYTTIGSIHSDQGAEEVIDQHTVGLLGCVAIEQRTNEPTYAIIFENDKEILTKRFEQVTSHKVSKERYQVGARTHRPNYLVNKIYQVEQGKRVVYYLLYSEYGKKCRAVPGDQCKRVNS